MKITWNFCQEKSNDILIDGLIKLQSSSICHAADVDCISCGNYLVSLEGIPHYIGEAKNLKTRLSQQFKQPTSTFYKNYLKAANDQIAKIDGFSLRYMKTEIGRKEIEDFGIVNLSTHLNRFQLNKRDRTDLKANGLWDEVQSSKDSLLNKAESEILNLKHLPWRKADVISSAGIYLVKDKNQLIYIGESSNILERHTTHSTKTYFSALRRHIGTELLGYDLKERNGKKKYFTDIEDKKITSYLTNTSAIFYPVSFGRYELEEFLIKKHKPLLNRKDNK